MFLSVKDQYAPAHKLMAQILERSTLAEDLKKAVHYYKRSFELDETQKQLTLKSVYTNICSEYGTTFKADWFQCLITVCSLFLRIELPAEQLSSASYWAEKTKAYYPNEPIVFSLQVSRHIITTYALLSDTTHICLSV